MRRSFATRLSDALRVVTMSILRRETADHRGTTIVSAATVAQRSSIVKQRSGDRRARINAGRGLMAMA